MEVAICIPDGTGPSVHRRRQRSRFVDQIADGEAASTRWDRRLCQWNLAIEPGLEGLQPLLTAVELKRPAQPGQMGGQGLRGHAVPVRVLKAIAVHSQAADDVRESVASSETNGHPVPNRLATLGATLDNCAAAWACIHPDRDDDPNSPLPMSIWPEAVRVDGEKPVWARP